MNKNQLIFGRRLIYDLKKRYGSRADLYHLLSVNDDVQTGKTIITKIKYNIRKAVLLPIDIATNINVPGGRNIPGLFPMQQLDISTRVILLDNKDLPDKFEISPKDYIIIHDERFNIKSIQELEDNVITAIVGSFTPGSDKEEIFDLKIKEVLRLDESLTVSV